MSCRAPDSPGVDSKQLIVAPLLRRESMGRLYHMLTFDVAAGIRAVPGQFVMLRATSWSEAPLLPRPMSLLAGGKEPAVLIKMVGEGTNRMARAEAGESFSLLGPLGKGWRLPRQAEKSILVAGGVGVAPLLFLARELHRRGTRPVFLYGGRSARDLPLDDEVAKVSDLHLTTEDGSRATRGLVIDALGCMLQPDSEVFACGPYRMMVRVAALCHSRGLPCQVSLETRMACGYGVCLGCAVPLRGGDFLYACTDGPCVDTDRIDWTEEQGLCSTQLPRACGLSS